jgi:anti-sigma B factor antagonist
LKILIDRVEAEGGNIAHVRLEGEVDLANADELSEVLAAPECADAFGLLLDLRNLEFMDSSGLRVILIAAQERKGRVATLVSASTSVASLFQMVDVSERLNVAPGEEEAMARIVDGADAPS